MKEFLSYIDTSIGRIFERIHTNTWVDTQALAYFRIFFGIFMLSHYLPQWQWFGSAPQAFFNPHMFTMTGFMDGFLPQWFYILLDLANILFFCLLTLGVRTRISLAFLFLINFFGYSSEFSFGKIDHEVHLYLIALLTLIFTNCGTKSALVKDKVLKTDVQKWAISLLSIYIAFGFFSAGIPKFLRWVDFDINEIGILDWFFKGFYTYDRTHLLAESVFKTPYWVFEFLDYMAPTLEILGFAFLLWSKRTWRIYIIIFSCFHMGNMLILNIEFALNITCYGIFLIAPFLSNIRKYLPQGKNAKSLLIAVVGALGIYQIWSVFHNLDRVYELGYFSEKFHTETYLSVLVWLITVFIGIFVLWKKLYEKQEEVNPNKII